MAHVLIVDDDAAVGYTMGSMIRKMGHTHSVAYTLNEGLEKGRSCQPDIVLLDVNLPDADGIESIETVRRLSSAPEVIIITGVGDPDGVEIAIKSGAWDYIEKSASVKQMTLPLKRALEYRSEKSAKAPAFLSRSDIIGSSPQMVSCLEQLAQAAVGDANVLITGETGTGKEVFADAIHKNSQRKEGNFAVVDCAALPHELVESILFGHEKGAFTGAEKSRIGLVKQADGGTLFLDEIGELPLNLQKTFLRVLEERRFRPIGSHRQVNSDFRLVAATNRDLEEMVDSGSFRQDLLFRIRTLLIELPPLRDRSRDIRDLAIHFSDKICDKTGMPPKRFAEDFFDALQSYPWPGNVRELLHALEHALSSARFDQTLFVKHLPNTIRVHLGRSGLKTERSGNGSKERVSCNRTLQEFREAAIAEAEKSYLKALLPSVRGDIKKACHISGLSRSRLYHLMKKYDIRRQAQNA